MQFIITYYNLVTTYGYISLAVCRFFSFIINWLILTMHLPRISRTFIPMICKSVCIHLLCASIILCVPTWKAAHVHTHKNFRSCTEKSSALSCFKLAGRVKGMCARLEKEQQPRGESANWHAQHSSSEKEHFKLNRKPCSLTMNIKSAFWGEKEKVLIEHCTATPHAPRKQDLMFFFWVLTPSHYLKHLSCITLH